MTRDEQAAYTEGKFAAWKDHRDQHIGARARCPYTVADRVRAWHQGYHDQQTELNPTIQLDAEAEQRRQEFVAACQDWLARNKMQPRKPSMDVSTEGISGSQSATL